MVTRGLVHRVVLSTGIAYRVPRHNLSKRHLNTAASSSSAVRPPDWKPPTIDWTLSRDRFVRAKTGACKTAAYILPAHIERHDARAAGSRPAGSVGSLVLAPTRESAVQIASDAQRLTTHRRGFEVLLLAGGADKAQQTKDWLQSSRDLVVATPGRLRDLLTNAPEFRQGFKGCPLLILDEADTLLSMGFRDDIDAIVSFLPRSPVRRTVLFSATTPRAVRQLASWVLSPDHVFVDAMGPDHGLTQPIYSRVEQFYTPCPTPSDQLPTLLKLLAHDQLTHGSRSKVIVFCPTAQMAELFAMLLRSLLDKVLPDDNPEIMRMHWRMSQSERDRVRLLFRDVGKTPNARSTVLVTSDISASATDYPGLTRAIQIGVPNRESVHVYRIQRMAHAAGSGKEAENTRPSVRADVLLLPWEVGYMNWQLTTLAIKPLSIPALDDQLASLSPQSPVLAPERVQHALAETQRSMDPADVRRTAASLLGYYLPLTPPLRLQPQEVLAGVSSWASECFHVAIPTIKRFPRKFTEAYEQSLQVGKTKGLFVDGLKLPSPSFLGKAKSKNRSVWEGANIRTKKPKRWY